MRQYLTRRNIAFGVMGFLLFITFFQFFIGKHIGNTKHGVDMKIQHVATLPDQNIQNEVINHQQTQDDSSSPNELIDQKVEKLVKEPLVVKKPTEIGAEEERKEETKIEQKVEKNSLPSSTEEASPQKKELKKNSKLKEKKEKKENTKTEEKKKSTKFPPVYFLFICTLDKEQCEVPRQANWKDSMVKSYNQISSSAAKDGAESISFIIFGGDSNIPSLFTHVDISQKGTIQTVSDYIANSIKNDNAMIVFITDFSVPVSISITDTYYILQDSILAGSVVINDKSGKIVNSGWDLKLRTCKGQTTSSVAFTPHMYGKDLTALLEDNNQEEEMLVFIPSLNGASILKQTWKYFGGFNVDYRKDYIFDFLLRIQEHNQIAPILPENIIKSYGSDSYQEYIVSDTDPCSLDEKILFRNAESEISKQYYENTMNAFFNKLEVKNINLVYTIPSDSTHSLQHISNAINMEGKVILKLNTTLTKIHMSDTERISFNRMKNFMHSDENIPLVSIAQFDPNWNCPRKQYCIGLLLTDIKQIKQEDINRMKQQYDEIWVNQQRHVKQLQRMGVKKKKTHYIPNGVDTSTFKQSDKKEMVSPTNYLSIFSDWEKERDQIKLLVQSFATSFDQVSNVKLSIFVQDFTSASNDKTSIEIIKQLGIETVFSKPPIIEILPLDTRQVELPAFYHDYHVLLILNNQNSRIVLQAMSSGILIVSSSELFEFLNKDNSLLVKQIKSIESWVETLKYIHSEGNISLIRELVKVARLDMEEYYDNAIVAKDILARLGDIEEYLNAH